MSRIIETTVYKFEELDESAKERARDWYRQCSNEDDDASYIFEDAARMASIMGIEIDTHPVKLMGGGTRQEHTIYYSGFCSQGDGACFEGSYSYKPGSIKAIAAEAPEDKTLHSIALQLYNLQRVNFYQLTATCKHSGRYYHSGCMSVDIERADEKEPTRGAEEELKDILRSFADWIYPQLETEHNYQMSEEVVDENIIANEYEFTAEGDIA